MKVALRCLVGLCALACLAQTQGCTDPGCIRNSECETGFSCLDQVCTKPSSDDGGTSTPSTPSKLDASSSEPDQPNAPEEPDLPEEDAGF